MRLHMSTSKRILMLALALCLCATLLSPSGFALSDSSHTHVCGDESHIKPEDCTDRRACCKKCIGLYNTKYPLLTPIPMITGTLSVHTESSTYAGNVLVYAEFSTLTSLKIRLNN